MNIIGTIIQSVQSFISLFGNILNSVVIEGIVVISVITVVFNFISRRSGVQPIYESEDEDDEYEYVLVRRRK